LLSLERGTSFSATAAAGVLAGALSQAGFALAYGLTSSRWGPGGALAAGIAAFIALTAVWQWVDPGLLFTGLIIFLGLLLAIRFMPASEAARAPRLMPAWDLPLRMLLATTLVLALTSAAPLLGPRLSGLLSPFPLFAMVLAVFAHRSSGPDAARDVLRGLLFGLFSFAAFCAVAALALSSFGIAAGLALATATCLGVQGLTLLILRRALA
jgi:hypothetical protein